MKWLSNTSLQHPYLTALGCLVIGATIGLSFECLFDVSFLGRFGAVTVALGVLTFGATASDLLIRSQVGMIADAEGDLPYPYNSENLSKVMSMQTLVVVFGTIQWGFADMLGGLIC